MKELITMDEILRSKITPSQKIILIILMRHASSSGYVAYISYKKISKESSLPQRTVIRGIEALKKHGLIKVNEIVNKEYKNPNSYYLLDINLPN